MSQTVEHSSALAASRELLDAVLRNLRDAVIVADTTGRRVYANDQAARLTGYATAAELVAAPVDEARKRFEILDADGAPLDPERLPGRRALAGEEPGPQLIRFRRLPDGAEQVSEVSAVVLRDEAGVPLYVISYFREVTAERELADQRESLYVAAQRTTALLDALYGGAPVGLGLWDRDLRYVRVNGALAEINERPVEDHTGRTLAEVVPQLAHVLEPIARRVLETREPVIALEMSSGTPQHPEEERYWRASYYPVVVEGGEAIGVGAVVEEITDRRRAEQRTELQHAVTRALGDAETVDAALPRVLQAIVETLGWEVACYWSVEPDDPRVVWTKQGAQLEGFVAMTERSILSAALLPGRVALSGEPEWLTELTPDRFARATVAAAEGLRSGVAFPIIVEGAVVGVVETFSTAPRSRDLQLERTLVAIGAQLGQFVRRRRAEEERLLLLQRERAARAEAEGAVSTLRKLGRVSEVALEHLSLSDLLHALLERIVEVLEADTAAILLIGDDHALHVRATVGLEEEERRAIPVPVGEGLAGRVAATRAPLLVPDLSQIELTSPVLRERGINSVVAIPLVVEDRVIGVLHAGSEAYAQFADDDARLLELIADRIALAINQAALFEAERAAQERLQFLGEASTLLAESLDVEATLMRVAQLAVPHFAAWCAVDLVRDDGRVERVAQTAEELPGEQLAVLLVARDRVLGELTFVSTTRRYTETDLQFAQELAARAAVAVDNAYLYRAAERRRDRLGFLAEASALLGSSLDVQHTLDQLSALIADRFADWVAVHLVQPDGTVRTATIAGRNLARTAEARAAVEALPPDREPPASVARVLASGVVEQWSSEGMDLVPGSFEAEEGLHSGIVVPLVARSRALGTLSLVRGETSEPYDEDDAEFAEDLGRRAAVAIDNAQLYHEAAFGRERLEFLTEASALLGSSLDVDRTLEQLSALVAGRVADWCSIHLASEGGPPRLVSIAHGDPETAARALSTVGRRVPDPHAHAGIGKVIASGEPELFPVVGPELLDAEARAAGLHSVIIVPLRAWGRTLGAMSLAWAETDARYDERDLEFALDLAGRAGVALDNARLYREADERGQAARVLASVGDGVFLVDRNGYIRTWNRAAATATGLQEQDVVDRIAHEAIPGWTAIVSRIPVAAAGGALRAESLPLDLGARELWLSIHGVIVPDGIVYAFRDLTEERALETMRTEFVSTVSHELRTPLAAIYGAAMTLRRSDVVLDEAQRAILLDVVSGEADRLARTVNDILWASRLDTDSLHVNIQACDPRTLIEDVVQAQRAHLGRGHEIVLDLAEDMPQVAGDPDKVGRVLINLVDNAVKYSPDGGRVEVVVEPVGSSVRFSVTDHGIGIPPSEQRRVFEKFYRLDPNMTRGVGGTGLGLYICRELVRRMEGRVWVESEGLGSGSTFHVELPVAGDF